MSKMDQGFETVEEVDRERAAALSWPNGRRFVAGRQLFGWSPASLKMVLFVGILCLGLMGCGSRRLNVVQTTQQTLVSVGYSSDRSRSVFRADNDAQEYCERQGRGVLFIEQDTVYQGQYDEDITSAARAAGRVADALGSSEAARASGALSSPTDYKTTLEFRCQ
jgi:hypothetical protein